MVDDISYRMENFSFTKEEDEEVPIPFREFQEVVSYGKKLCYGKTGY